MTESSTENVRSAPYAGAAPPKSGSGQERFSTFTLHKEMRVRV